MSSCPSPCDKEHIRSLILNSGAIAAGFAEAAPVDDETIARYNRWIDAGHHAGMAYMERYPDVRRDPRLLLDGARTLIVAAFNYTPSRRQPAGAPRIADYALGKDYHDVVRARLTDAAAGICSIYGGTTRVCVDTAPLRERYWATRAGLGFIGLNNQLIIPGKGSRCFIGTILWTGTVTPDEPCNGSCGNCGACIKACPAGALHPDGSGVDARRCLSYLTIEHRGELPEKLRTGGRLYGCDACQDVCPHNRLAPVSAIPEFSPKDELLDLTSSDIAAMDNTGFKSLFGDSAIRRTKLAGLHRNLHHL